MSDRMDGSWSNRKRTFTIGGMLGAIASPVTIVSFLTAHSTSAAPSSLSQNPAGSLAYPSSSAPPSHQSTTSSISSTASTSSSYLSNCEQNVSGPSFCRCTLNWFEANVTQAQFAQDLAMFRRWEQNQTGDPPPDMVKAAVACTG